MIDDKIKKVSCGGSNIAKIISGGVSVASNKSRYVPKAQTRT